MGSLVCTRNVGSWALFAGSIFLTLLCIGCTAGSAGKEFRRDTASIQRELEKGHALLANADTTSWAEALLIARNTAKRSTTTGYPKGNVDSYILAAQAHQKAGRITEARQAQQNAINILAQQQLTGDLATAYGQLASMYDLYSDERKQRIAYFEEAARLYGLAGRLQDQGNVLEQVGDFCMIDADFLKAQRVLHNAIDIYDSIQYRNKQGAYTLLNQVYIYLQNYTKAAECGWNALAYCQATNDTSIHLCTVYNRLGAAQLFKHDYDSAQCSFNKALQIAKRLNDKASLPVVIPNLLNAYMKAGEYDSCIAAVQQHLPLSTNMDRELKNTHYYFMLDAYSGKKNYTEAEQYYQLLRNNIPKSGETEIERHTYISMIRYKVKVGDFSESKQLIKKAVAVYQKFQMLTPLKLAYYQQYKSDSSLGNLSAAILSYKKFKEVSDSIFETSRKKQVASLEKQFHSEVALRDQLKEQNLELFSTQSKLQKAELSQANTRMYFLTGGLLLTFALLVAGYRVYLLKQRSNRLLEKQKKEIDQQNISLKRLVDQQVKLLSEKEWLIKEVHHRVKNNLQIIVSLLNFQSKALKDENARDAIRNSQHRVNAMAFIHQRLYKTNNMEVISIDSYITELIQYLKEALHSDKQVDFITEVIPIELSVAQVVPIGLILNEAITNSVKYAFDEQPSPRIRVGIDYDGPAHILLTIADNGSGIPDTPENGRFGTLGFSLMQTMAEQLEAEFAIENDEGLTLTFRLRHAPDWVHHTETNETYA